MGLDITSFAAALKKHYTKQRLEEMVYKDNPFLAMVKKKEDAGGDSIPIPIRYANPQGRSATFATAQAKAATSNSQIKQFALTRVKDYGIVQIDNETIEASKGDANAFMEARVTEIDGIINALNRSLGIAMFRQGWGEIGVASAITGSQLTMTTLSDVTNVEIGQDHVFSSSIDGATLRDSGDEITVTNVDRTTGVVTYDETIASVNLLANGDTIFIDGDRQNSATPTRLKIAGLAAWVPYVAPTSTAFFGVDRSVDTRLGGLRMDGSALSIEDAIITGASKLAREGGRPDKAFMSFETYAAVEKALTGRVQYVDLKASPEIGFRGIRINGPKGPIDLVADQNCPSNRVWLVEMDSFKLYSLGKAPRILNMDGLEAMRQASADGIEVRYGYYANLGCDAPGHNLVMAV